MKLSIMVHANYNRADRVQCLLTRLTLNKNLHGNIDFEVVLFDGGSTDNTKDLCDHFAKYLNLKYIYCPLTGPTSHSYPISIMSRLCSGENIAYVSADHWISENFVSSMATNSLKIILGQVARSEDSLVFVDPAKMVDQLLDDRCSNKKLDSVMTTAGLDPFNHIHPEIWCVKRDHLPDFTENWNRELTKEEHCITFGAIAIRMWTPPQKLDKCPEHFGKLPEYGYAIVGGKTLDRTEMEEYIESTKV